MFDAIIKQIPALLVVLPLFGAPLMLMIRSRNLVYILTSIIMYINAVLAIIMMFEVSKYGVVSYHFGNWAPPIGIEFRIDHLSAIVLLFVTLSTAIMMPWMHNACRAFIENRREYLFFVLLLLNYAGLLGMAATNDAFNLFVFLEISSLSTYAMIALGKERRGIMASFNYLLMGTIGATFYIIAISMLYQATGSLNISDMAARLIEHKDSRTLFVALAFIFTGFALKAAIFPLQAWLPRVYTYAPNPTTTFLAATATKVSLYALIRMGINFFQISKASETGIYSWIFISLGVAAMIIGAASATRQHNIKQILAFSSISQMGYMVMAFGFSFSAQQNVADAGLVAATVHMFNHAILKGLLFMAVGAMAMRGIAPWLVQLQGRARSMPITMTLFIIGGLGLIGVPGSLGFISKWYLIRMAVLQDNWFAVFAILVTSLLAVAYFWRIIEVGFMMKPHPKAPEVEEAPRPMLFSMFVSVLIIFGLGVYSSPLTGFINKMPEAMRAHPPQKIIIPLEPLSKKYQQSYDAGDH